MINRWNNMDLNCLNDIITDNLAIHIDLTDLDSWDLNTGLTAISLTKWYNAKAANLNLLDWGLTAFDIGRTNEMWGSFQITPQDTLFSVYPIGYNVVENPTSGETTGMTITTEYYPISAVTTGDTGNYFELYGGYLQGFFKLENYPYELFPARCNGGITIETLLYLYPDSEGIFYTMGARAEDKYNPYFSGETTINGNNVSGVITSEDHYLEAIQEKEVVKNAFGDFSDRFETEYIETSQSANTKNNIIAFAITQNKKLSYSYIDENNQVVTNKSVRSISPATGWTMIAITFEPDELIEDPDVLDCYPQRKGKFMVYVNGRPIWIIDDYPEFFFHAFVNDREKQIGVPYTISWGGGTFGLKHSWHYDLQTYGLYRGQNTQYINNLFDVESDPLPEVCAQFSGGTLLNGLSLSADSSTFARQDDCDPTIMHPITTMRIEYTGNTTGTTGQTGTSAQTYFIKYAQPITVLSNREYTVELNLYNNGFFKTYDSNGYRVKNNVSIFVYGTEDVDILDEGEYKYPLTSDDIQDLPNIGLHPFPDRQEYQYIRDGISYYGVTGEPVYDDPDYYLYYGVDPVTNQPIRGSVVTGQNTWLPIQTKFKVKDNTGKQMVYIGLLIQTTDNFNENSPLFVSDFTYEGADILSQDPRKNDLLIQQNFDSSFYGGIQKLRVYDVALNSQQILHNALMEMKKNPYLNLRISKGGRLIYR